MRRRIALLLALALLCGLSAASARASEAGKTYGVLDGLAYYIEDGQVTIYDGKLTGRPEEELFEIPARIDGCPVTQVELRAFSGVRKLLFPPFVTRVNSLPGDVYGFKLFLYYPGTYAEQYCRRGEIESQNVFLYWGVPFSDTPENLWYHESVCFCYHTGLMNGTGAQTFSPNAEATRAMLVTVLWRMAGAPEPESPCPFDDVRAGSWYAPAVRWAHETGVSNGVSETAFAPDRPVTREQIAALLLRFAQTQGTAADGRAEITGYPDAGDVSDWALEGMQWAREAGIVKGNLRGGDVYLDPRSRARRCEIAEMLLRFCLGGR